nr:prepilin peptidase [Enterobacter kobei]
MGILTWRLPAEILRPSSTGEAGSTSEFTFSGSRCCQCQTPLFWYDTVPLLGWMLLDLDPPFPDSFCILS